MSTWTLRPRPVGIRSLMTLAITVALASCSGNGPGARSSATTSPNFSTVPSTSDTSSTSTPATSTPASSTPATSPSSASTRETTAPAVTDPVTTAQTSTSETDPELPSGGPGTLTVNGLDRTYEVYVPASATSNDRLSIVIGLHGGGGSAAQFAKSSKFRELADREGFIAVFPDGVLGTPLTREIELRTWNAGNCCGPAARDKVDDVAFLAQLASETAKRFDVPMSRVGFVGHSNGAMMTWRMACERPDVLGAAVIVAGSLEMTNIGDCQPSQGVPLLVIHGDADANHPLEGGRGNGIAGVAFRSVSESFDAWTSAQKCLPASEPSIDGALNTTEWGGCADDTLARLVVVAGAEHAWPGASGATTSLAGTPSDKIDATAAAWQFIDDQIS